LLAAVVWRYARLVRAVKSAEQIDEGPIRVALEQIALELQLQRVPDLYSTKLVTSPFLIGVFQPRIVLPQRALEELSEVEWRAVLTHELVHFKHHDTWVGWLQVLAQGIFWFHPFLWWANSQLRHQRECVCDEAVLRLGRITPQRYSESIVHVLTASRGRSLVAGSLAGVFERGDKLQDRLENIMNYEQNTPRFHWPARLVLAALAVLLLPMGPGPATTSLAENPPAKEKTGPPRTKYPQIVKSSPAAGETDVSPDLKEITVTFDRDMGKGMSWTGGPPNFPPVDESQKARWTDARTCVLPVKLERGKFYRVGINSTSNQNFRGSDGVPAPSSVLYFATKGAATDIMNRVRSPKIVSGKKPSWSKDGKTCSLPVALEPGKDYKLGLNSLSHINFQSESGVPLAPVIYTFKTRQ
jgi:hypothetical protein